MELTRSYLVPNSKKQIGNNLISCLIWQVFVTGLSAQLDPRKQPVARKSNHSQEQLAALFADQLVFVCLCCCLLVCLWAECWNLSYTSWNELSSCARDKHSAGLTESDGKVKLATNRMF